MATFQAVNKTSPRNYVTLQNCARPFVLCSHATMSQTDCYWAKDIFTGGFFCCYLKACILNAWSVSNGLFLTRPDVNRVILRCLSVLELSFDMPTYSLLWRIHTYTQASYWRASQKTTTQGYHATDYLLGWLQHILGFNHSRSHQYLPPPTFPLTPKH